MGRKKKILIVTQHFYPENFRINDVAIDLKARGFEVDVLTNQPDYPSPKHFEGHKEKKQNSWKGIPIKRIPIISRGNGGHLRLLLNYISFVFSASLFGRPKNNYDFCLVWASSPITVALPAIFFKKTRGIPVAVWVQDLWPETIEDLGVLKKPFLLSLLKKLVSYIYKNSDLLLIQSPKFQESLIENGADPDKIVYVPNWSDFNSTEIANVPPVEIPETGFNVIYAGNLGKAQNLDTLIDVAKMSLNIDVNWFLIGDGRDQARLKARILSEGLSHRVKMVGLLNPSELNYYYDRCDAVYMSLGKGQALYKTIPSKFQTYLAAGKPILASSDGITHELITENDLGVAAPAGDAHALFESLLLLMSYNPEKQKSISDNNLRFYKQNFDRPLILEKIGKLIKDAA